MRLIARLRDWPETISSQCFCASISQSRGSFGVDPVSTWDMIPFLLNSAQDSLCFQLTHEIACDTRLPDCALHEIDHIASGTRLCEIGDISRLWRGLNLRDYNSDQIARLPCARDCKSQPVPASPSSGPAGHEVASQTARIVQGHVVRIQPVSQPASPAASQPTSQPASQPANQLASRPASQFACLPAWKDRGAYLGSSTLKP